MAKILRAIKPNAGIRAKYRRRLEAMIDDMNRSVVWWLRAEYRREENRIAQDASPAAALGKRIQTLFRYWMRRWQNKLEDFARDFVHSTERKTRNSIKQALKDAGFTVRMDPARAENDVTAALIRENVALIKSIPEHYFTEVTGLVMRSASPNATPSPNAAPSSSPATSPTRPRRPYAALKQRNLVLPRASGCMCRAQSPAARRTCR